MKIQDKNQGSLTPDDLKAAVDMIEEASKQPLPRVMWKCDSGHVIWDEYICGKCGDNILRRLKSALNNLEL